jgi:hypothetical protein
VRDDDVRTSCFAQLSILWAEFGEDVPHRGGLNRGFAFRGQRVPYLSPQKGIFRAAVQRGPAALPIQTSANSPYRDVESPRNALGDSSAQACVRAVRYGWRETVSAVLTNSCCSLHGLGAFGTHLGVCVGLTHHRSSPSGRE